MLESTWILHIDINTYIFTKERRCDEHDDSIETEDHAAHGLREALLRGLAREERRHDTHGAEAHEVHERERSQGEALVAREVPHRAGPQPGLRTD